MTKNDKMVQLMERYQNMEMPLGIDEESLAKELEAECRSRIQSLAAIHNFRICDEWSFEDMFQDIMLKVWTERKKFNPNKAGFNKWLTVLSISIYQKHYNKFYGKNARQVSTVSMYVECEGGEEINLIDENCFEPSAEKRAFTKVFWNQFYDELDKMPENYRKVVKMCDLDGYKPAQAAKVLGGKAEDVSRWLQRAHKNLRKYIPIEEIYSELAA